MPTASRMSSTTGNQWIMLLQALPSIHHRKSIDLLLLVLPSTGNGRRGGGITACSHSAAARAAFNGKREEGKEDGFKSNGEGCGGRRRRRWILARAALGLWFAAEGAALAGDEGEAILEPLTGGPN